MHRYSLLGLFFNYDLLILFLYALSFSLLYIALKASSAVWTTVLIAIASFCLMYNYTVRESAIISIPFWFAFFFF